MYYGRFTMTSSIKHITETSPSEGWFWCLMPAQSFRERELMSYMVPEPCQLLHFWRCLWYNAYTVRTIGSVRERGTAGLHSHCYEGRFCIVIALFVISVELDFPFSLPFIQADTYVYQGIFTTYVLICANTCKSLKAPNSREWPSRIPSKMKQKATEELWRNGSRA